MKPTLPLFWLRVLIDKHSSVGIVQRNEPIAEHLISVLAGSHPPPDAPSR